ncbi:MAG: hypothetical protein WC475_01530 [Candidatus Paceibacterota bacterium]
MARKKKWTQEKIVEELRKLHQEGVPLNYTHIRGNYSGLYPAMVKYFGTYRQAIEASGLDYDLTKRRLKKIKLLGWTSEKVIKTILKLYQAKESIHPCYIRANYRALDCAARKYFGSYKKAAGVAGLDYAIRVRGMEVRVESIDDKKMEESRQRIERLKGLKRKLREGERLARFRKIWLEKHLSEGIKDKDLLKDFLSGKVEYEEVLSKLTTVSETIIFLRTQKGLFISEVSKGAGIDRYVLYNLERKRNRSLIRPEQVNRLADFFSVPQSLFSEKDLKVEANEKRFVRELSEEETEKIVKKYFGKILFLIKETLRWKTSKFSKDDWDDFKQEGVVGLLDAARSFRPGKASLGTFANFGIKNAIQKCLADRRSIRIPPEKFYAIRKTRAIFEGFKRDFKRPPTIEELAERLNTSVSQAKIFLDFLTNFPRTAISLNEPLNNSANEEFGEVGDTIPDPKFFLEELMEKDSRKNAKGILKEIFSKATLSPRELFVIKKTFPLEGEKSFNLVDIGRELNLNYNTISQTRDNALGKLRSAAVDLGISPDDF